jgi:hypothetical protein
LKAFIRLCGHLEGQLLRSPERSHNPGPGRGGVRRSGGGDGGASVSKHLAALFGQYERGHKNPSARYDIVPTPKRIFHNVVRFEFICGTEIRAFVNLIIAQFDMKGPGAQ